MSDISPIMLKLHIVARKPRRIADRIPYTKVIPALLEHCATEPALRDCYLVGSLLYATGLRKQEALELRWDQVNLEDLYLVVNPNSRIRRVLFSVETHAILQSLREQHPQSDFVLGPSPKKFLFRMLQHLRHICSDLECPALRFHSFRWACAQRMYEAGDSPAEICQFLGVSSTTTMTIQLASPTNRKEPK